MKAHTPSKQAPKDKVLKEALTLAQKTYDGLKKQEQGF